MKRHLFSGLFLLFSFGMGAYASQEKYVSFNDNWLFTLSDSHDYSLTTYNPEGWRQLDLPHDWTIEKPFDKNLEGCTAFTPGGIDGILRFSKLKSVKTRNVISSSMACITMRIFG